MKLSVVIPTYNRYPDLQECLESLFNMKEKPYEILVVDSCSTDGTKIVKNSYPIRFISIHERNRMKAKNLGVSKARGEIVAFLDDDVVVHNDWSRFLIDPYKDNRVGGVGGRVIPYGIRPTQYFPTNNEVVGSVSDDGMVIGNFDLPLRSRAEVDCLIGCNMSFRKNLLEKIGGFDESFEGNCYREDTDCCLRIKNTKHKIIYEPKALVWHKFKGKKPSSKWVYWYVRNHTYFYLKNIFPTSRTKLPIFLYRMFFPPRNYVLKSGVKVKFKPKVLMLALIGIINGFKAYKKFANL